MTRIAHCSCGSLRAETGASGSVSLHEAPTPYWLGLWRRHLFPERAGARRGAEQGLRARRQLGAKGRIAFLPRLRFYCVLVLGTFPGPIGIAFGAFADPSMPWPPVSVWETTRHPWVTFDHKLLHFEREPELVERPAAARR
jgi:hypothetical protein